MFLGTHLYTHTFGLGGWWVGGWGGDGNIPWTCIHSQLYAHTHTFGLGGLGMVTYLGLAYIPNCTHTHTHTYLWVGWVGGWVGDGNIPWTCRHSHTGSHVQSAKEWTASVRMLHVSTPVMQPVLKVLRNGLLRYILTHVHTCNVTRVQSATEWTAAVHTLHMSKPVV